MRTNNNIYLSDLLTVPMPKHATSHRDFLRRIRNRRILWALLPYIGEALVGITTLCLTLGGIMTLMVGLGG